MKVKIGIRPTIDGRLDGVRENLENQTVNMAVAAKKIIETSVFYADGTACECVISPVTIGGSKEAAICEDYFISQNVVATLTVTPCWCYGTETIDMNPNTIKAIWGFNGTERPGAVYLAAAMAAHNQFNLPAFAIYGKDVQDADDNSVPNDVYKKIITFAKCALAVGQMKNKSFVSIGSVSMGIAGSMLNPYLMKDYFNIRPEWIDMTEILRRIEKEIFDKEEFKKALKWADKNCIFGEDYNYSLWDSKIKYSEKEKKEQFEFSIKFTLIVKDIMNGNPKLKKAGFGEEALGRNAIAGGFQGQRAWTDYKPNADFCESILNSSFDWNGKREPITLATENDTLNGICMLFLKLLTGKASIFADVRTYWSPDSVYRVTKKKLSGLASNGFIHLLNSGAAAVDGTGVCKDENGKNCMKKWWEISENDISNMLKNTKWTPANTGYFRGGGFSSQYNTEGEMPVTLIRMNLIGNTPTLQIAEGYTCQLDKDVNDILLNRTDRTWPSTWFTPILDKNNPAFSSVYNVMANWGANHCAFVNGHVGADLITLASMLRIFVSMHNVDSKKIYRPNCWAGFGTKCLEVADYNACNYYGPLYK